MWWKTFSAVLAAGLIVFGVHRWDIAQDRAAAEWNSTALSYTKSLAYFENRTGLGNPIEDVRLILTDAKGVLQRAPMRAESAELKSAIERAESFISKQTLAKK